LKLNKINFSCSYAPIKPFIRHF